MAGDDSYWPFKPGASKFGYINNPRWTDVPEFADKHSPCGYWPKDRRLMPTMPTNGNVFGAGDRSNFKGSDYSGDAHTFEYLPELGHIEKIFSTYSGFLAIDNEGRMFAVGVKEGTGYGTSGILNKWKEVTEPGPWREVASNCYARFMFAIKQDGTLWRTGWNQYGQLGTGDTGNLSNWTQYGVANDWAKCSVGTEHTLILTESGDLYGTGLYYLGAYDTGYSAWGYLDEFILLTTGVVDITAGNRFSMLTRADGRLYVTGSNWVGNLGTGDDIDLYWFTDANVAAQGAGVPDRISLFTQNSMFVDQGGNLWAAGRNDSYQLGLPDTIDYLLFNQVPGSNWLDVSTYNNSTLALRVDRSLWVTGRNDASKLGLGHSNQVEEFEQVPNLQCLQIANSYNATLIIVWDGMFNWE